MANQARAGAVRANAFLSGLYARDHSVTLSGSNPSTVRPGLTISQSLDSPDTLKCELIDTAPTQLAFINVFEGLPNRPIFLGNVMRCSEQLDKDLVIYDVEAQDLTWFLDRYRVVNAEYVDLSIGTIVADICENFTDRFYLGHTEASFGSVTITFDGVRVSEALTQLAAAATGDVYWRISTGGDLSIKRIDFFDTFPDGVSLSIGNATDVQGLEHEQSSDQIRNRVVVIGAGSQATSVAYKTDTEIAVEDTQYFSASGGKGSVRGSADLFDYVSKSVPSGPGLLGGVTNLNWTIYAGDVVSTAALDEDTTEQTAIEALGGWSGLSGDIEHVVKDDALSYDEVVELAASQLAAYAPVTESITYTDRRVQLQSFNDVGRTVSLSITSPITKTATHRIRSVAVEHVGPGGSGESIFKRKVSASSSPERNITQLMEKRKEVKV